MTNTNEKKWAELPSVMGAWGEVGISLAHANRAAQMVQNDPSPSMQRRIQRNLLLEQMEEYHAKAKRLEREAASLQKQASGKVKAAARKAHVASSTGCNEKKAHLHSQVEPLEKEGSVLLQEADKRLEEALDSREEEEKTQREIWRLDRPEEDLTVHMDEHEFE